MIQPAVYTGWIDPALKSSTPHPAHTVHLVLLTFKHCYAYRPHPSSLKFEVSHPIARVGSI